jgi:hypothetical protein
MEHSFDEDDYFPFEESDGCRRAAEARRVEKASLARHAELVKAEIDKAVRQIEAGDFEPVAFDGDC